MGQGIIARPAARAGLLALGLCAILVIWALALTALGMIRVDLYEGDALHLADIALRMAQGQWPHLDFMTPLGVATAAPIAAFVVAGDGIGTALMKSQIALAAALTPILWWIGVTRLRSLWIALALGFLVLTLVMALVHGEARGAISVSMHYNRWAWGVAFIALALALLPPDKPRPWVEGVLFGLAFSALALGKVTYFVAFLPACLVALLIRGETRTVLVALGTGALVIVLVTVLAGPAFWFAYFGDLMAVSGSDHRSAPGMRLSAVIAAPPFIGGSLAAFTGVILLRQSGQAQAGLVLLLAVPGFFIVTWQNFGNDPQWLPFLGLMLLALRPEADGARAITLVATVALALGLPSLINTAASPFRHATNTVVTYAPLLPTMPQHHDLQLPQVLASAVQGRVPLKGFDSEPGLELLGETLPRCEMQSGTVDAFVAMADGLNSLGQGERPALVADLYSFLWLFGAGEPLPGGAPWYYDGLPGGEAAEILIVPFCPLAAVLREGILDEADAAGWQLTEIGRTDIAIYLEVAKPAQTP